MIIFNPTNAHNGAAVIVHFSISHFWMWRRAQEGTAANVKGHSEIWATLAIFVLLLREGKMWHEIVKRNLRKLTSNLYSQKCSFRELALCFWRKLVARRASQTYLKVFGTSSGLRGVFLSLHDYLQGLRPLCTWTQEAIFPWSICPLSGQRLLDFCSCDAAAPTATPWPLFVPNIYWVSLCNS